MMKREKKEHLFAPSLRQSTPIQSGHFVDPAPRDDMVDFACYGGIHHVDSDGTHHVRLPGTYLFAAQGTE